MLEGASYALSVKPDAKLSAYLDGVIAKIAAAQEADGYLYTTRTIDPAHPHEWAGNDRWVSEEVLSHELYNAGHLYEAAVAHYQATGKRSLLDVATKNADLLVRTFGPGKRKIYPATRWPRWGWSSCIASPGRRSTWTWRSSCWTVAAAASPYNQADTPVVQQTYAEGHAVRATYMYSGMADVAAMEGDQAYIHALDRIWENVVDKKIYVSRGSSAAPTCRDRLRRTTLTLGPLLVRLPIISPSS